MYIIRRASDRDAFLKAPDLYPSVRIETCPWGGEYRPETFFSAAHSDTAIYVRMRTNEKDPRVVTTERNGPVWCDSAMEFFIAPGCDVSEGYFNCEMNAYPALLCHFGVDTDDEHRHPVDWPLEDFQLECIRYVEDNRPWWELHLTVPYALLSKHVPSFDPKPGTVIHGNAYKCGDDCEIPHFITLFPIDPAVVREPAFHVPAYFGELVLE